MSTDRIITGICATPTVDSHGQIATTSAYIWKAPLPLLLEHRRPLVGTVTRLWREGEAIHFAAKVTDDATWQRIEGGELRGASIALKHTKCERDAVERRVIKEGELLEVSVVVAPANPDCQFSIASTARPIRRKPKPAAVSQPPRASLAPREWQVKNLPAPCYPLGARKAGDAAALVAARKAFFEFFTHCDMPKWARDGHFSPDMLVKLELLLVFTADAKAAESWASARMAEAEERIAALEASQQFFRGTHQRALGYTKGSLVTHDGGLWVALVDVLQGAVPGKSDAWQLAVKRGDSG